MKTTLLTILLALSAFCMVGCENDTETILIVDELPAAPQGVYSVTGDGAVYVFWNGPYETDISNYTVYRSLNATTGYTLIGILNASSNPNLDLITYEYVDNTALNGVTYYYAVSSVDDAGQESELSAETVSDTPRPEGVVTLYHADFDPLSAGLILDTTLWIVAYNDADADVFVDADTNSSGNAVTFYLNSAYIDVDLQDMGYADSFDSLDVAPLDGWSNNGWVELIEGHNYVVWDDDFFFAKLRVESFGANSVNFRWAFQLDADNPELVQPKHEAEKPIHINYNAKRSISANQ